MLWRAARPETDESLAPEPETVGEEPRVAILAAIGCLGLVSAFFAERDVLDSVGALGRVAGVIGYGIAVVLIASLLRTPSLRSPDGWSARWVLAAAVLVMVLHAQIELTMFEPSAIVWVACTLGLSAGARPVRAGPFGAIIVAAVFVLAGAVAIFAAAPATIEARGMRQAAALLEPVGEVRWRLQYVLSQPDPAGSGPSLLSIAESLGQLGVPAEAIAGLGLRETAERGERLTREQVSRCMALLAGPEQQRRIEAADRLESTWEAWPLDRHPLEAAAQQLQIAAFGSNPPRLDLLERAGELADRAVENHGRSSSVALAQGIHSRLAMLTGREDHRASAVALARRLTSIDPHGNASWKRLGDTLWSSGDRAARPTPTAGPCQPTPTSISIPSSSSPIATDR